MQPMNRRLFLTAGAGSVLALPSLALGQGVAARDPDAGVTAPEDLMREHGLLDRCLLIYEAAIRQLERKQSDSPEVFAKTASLIRRFVENYHERSEESYIFPEFEKVPKHVDLVTVLKAQHHAGRKVTARILALTDPATFRENANRDKLVAACRSFIRMYRPHAAREDTVIFVSLRSILPPERVVALGELMEKDEKTILGEGGFESCVEEAAVIEQRLGIGDLSSVTPADPDA